MIRTFRDPDAAALFAGDVVQRLHACARVGYRRLQQLDAARDLRDLAAIPGNRLESLTGDRRGQYSIRINDQYRICFAWRGADAYNVEIVDYH